MDREKAEAFAGRMLGMLNQSSLALMTSIGHRSGLFDAMAPLPPSTSPQIAAKAGLDERYVREWLGAMVMGGIVEYEPAAGTYRLPAEHAACLTRAAAPNNMAPFFQYIPILGQVEDRILECFKKGGGVPYSAFPRFHDVMAEDSGQTVLPCLLELILPLVPGLKDRLASGIDVLEIGCGQGKALNLLARTFPRSRFLGYDLSAEAIAAARAEATAPNVRFEIRDTTSFDPGGGYDLILTFDAVHDQARPDLVLKGIARALRPGGVYLMQDIRASSRVEKNLDHPAGTFLYTVSCLHCMTVSLAQKDGMGVGAVWGEELTTKMLREAGFSSIRVERLAHDFQNNYYIVGK